MSDKNITVVIVGMGFGKEFIPIYQSHPNIKAVGICTRNKNTLAELAATYKLDRIYVSNILRMYPAGTMLMQYIL